MEQALADIQKALSIVSIPERVWGGLEPVGHLAGRPHRTFQSLRGFGVGWSGAEIAESHAMGSVSIPERVWGGLEPSTPGSPAIPEPCFNP